MSQAPERILIKGNEAIVRGALDAGCRCYFGYPITPQNEIPEAFSSMLPEQGGSFVQAESELAAVNMLLGAAACGIPAMTSSSSCGIALMQETISYMAGSCVPGVIVNMMRGGPGLGDIGPSQSDYFQAVKGGGNGDHRNFVLAPATAQECYDMMFSAFALAFKYRNPVMVLGDAIVGQMKEPVRCVPPKHALTPEQLMQQGEDWRLEGYDRHAVPEPRVLRSLLLKEGQLAAHNRSLHEKYSAMRQEAAAEQVFCDDASLVVVAFGSIARIAHSAVRHLRQAGHKVGLFRPTTLYPFPEEALRALISSGKRRFLVIEQNLGQMVEDVRLAIDGQAPVSWHGILPDLYVGAETLRAPILEALEGGKHV